MQVSWSWLYQPLPFIENGITATVDDGQGGTADLTLTADGVAPGLLAALLLPAVQAAREAARRDSTGDDEPTISDWKFELSNEDGGSPALSGDWTLTAVNDENLTFDFRDTSIPEVRATIKEIIFDGDEGTENLEHGDLDRFVFGFEKTVGDPGTIVNVDISHQYDGGDLSLREAIVVANNSGVEIEVVNDISVAIGEDAPQGRVFVDHNQIHVVTHDGPEMSGLGKTTHDFTSDFFV